jgi:hypothetical protein
VASLAVRRKNSCLMISLMTAELFVFQEAGLKIFLSWRPSLFVERTIHIQNVPSRNDPSQNDPSHNVPSRNAPVTKGPRSRNGPSLKVPSPNDPSHETTQITKWPRSYNWQTLVFLEHLYSITSRIIPCQKSVVDVGFTLYWKIKSAISLYTVYFIRYYSYPSDIGGFLTQYSFEKSAI